MARLDFVPALVNNGFKIYGTDTQLTAIGASGDYAVTLACAQYTAQLKYAVDIADFTEIRQRLMEIPGVKGKPIYAKQMLTINLKLSGGRNADNSELFSGVMSGASSVLRQHGVRPLDVCPFCGRGGCDVLVLHKGLCRPAHRACMSQAAGAIREKAERNAVEGSYLTGILGAIVGMLVGCIPSILTIVFMETIYAILFAAIPLCAYYGYKLARGRMNKAALIVSIALTVVGVFCIEFALIVIYLMTEYGAGLGESLSFLGSMLAEWDTWVSVVTSDWQSFLFAALGVFFVWSLISRTSEDEVQAVKNILDTAIPNPAAMTSSAFDE